MNFDLLSPEDFLAVSQNPAVIEQSIGSNTRCVVIDEIQKAPNLLDEVHRLIETRKVHFLLTGSSARKLRRGGVNLLGGRARPMRFHPLLKRELGTEFSLQKALAYGTLPSVYLSETPRKELAAYSGIYLKEEIVAEGLVRNLPSFSRLLEITAISNGTIVNFTNLANDAQVPRTMVYEYFDILKDTLIIDELPAWRESRRRKPIVGSKYYFFDVGVASMLQGRSADISVCVLNPEEDMSMALTFFPTTCSSMNSGKVGIYTSSANTLRAPKHSYNKDESRGGIMVPHFNQPLIERSFQHLPHRAIHFCSRTWIDSKRIEIWPNAMHPRSASLDFDSCIVSFSQKYKTCKDELLSK